MARYAYFVVEHGFKNGNDALTYLKDCCKLPQSATIDNYGATGSTAGRREWLSVKVPWAERQQAAETLADEDAESNPAPVPMFRTAADARERINEAVDAVFFGLGR